MQKIRDHAFLPVIWTYLVLDAYSALRQWGWLLQVAVAKALTACRAEHGEPGLSTSKVSMQIRPEPALQLLSGRIIRLQLPFVSGNSRW